MPEVPSSYCAAAVDGARDVDPFRATGGPLHLAAQTLPAEQRVLNVHQARAVLARELARQVRRPAQLHDPDRPEHVTDRTHTSVSLAPAQQLVAPRYDRKRPQPARRKLDEQGRKGAGSLRGRGVLRHHDGHWEGLGWPRPPPRTLGPAHRPPATPRPRTGPTPRGRRCRSQGRSRRSSPAEPWNAARRAALAPGYGPTGAGAAGCPRTTTALPLPGRAMGRCSSSAARLLLAEAVVPRYAACGYLACLPAAVPARRARGARHKTEWPRARMRHARALPRRGACARPKTRVGLDVVENLASAVGSVARTPDSSRRTSRTWSW